MRSYREQTRSKYEFVVVAERDTVACYDTDVFKTISPTKNPTQTRVERGD